MAEEFLNSEYFVLMIEMKLLIHPLVLGHLEFYL